MKEDAAATADTYSEDSDADSAEADDKAAEFEAAEAADRKDAFDADDTEAAEAKAAEVAAASEAITLDSATKAADSIEDWVGFKLLMNGKQAALLSMQLNELVEDAVVDVGAADGDGGTVMLTSSGAIEEICDDSDAHNDEYDGSRDSAPRLQAADSVVVVVVPVTEHPLTVEQFVAHSVVRLSVVDGCVMVAFDVTHVTVQLNTAEVEEHWVSVGPLEPGCWPPEPPGGLGAIVGY